MPASDISRISGFAGQPSDAAAAIAKSVADREIGFKIKSGLLKQNDLASIDREYRAIYSQEYYKYYAHLLHQNQQSRVIYVNAENPAKKRYFARHTVAKFSKLNCFIHVHRDCITVGRISFPVDDEISLETKEAFLTAWPGPLDRAEANLKQKVTDYVETLWQHDSQRRIRYCISANDDQRKTILKLLTELLHRNGSIDAPGITRLLLRPEQTEIQKDEGNRKPLETLQKYLLLGKRSEAIKFAKARKLWDHAQCLAFLDKYQPPNTSNYVKDSFRLKDDPIVQLNDEYISSIEHGVLNTVYRSLLNKVLKSDPESVNIIKYPNVANNSYEFAILSANDCEMEFDQTNEIFKLIVAVKQAIQSPTIANSHLIALGYTTLDAYDSSDELSYRSHLSFRQGDTYASKTLTISNIDMLILNEIWEYCLNLAKGTCNPINYGYIIDLVPYKLIFASKLLDFGLHKMFSSYLVSIKNALHRAKSLDFVDRDPFYDWLAIERSVEHLTTFWETLCLDFEAGELPPQTISNPESPISQHLPNPAIPHNFQQNYDHQALFLREQNETQPDHIDSTQNNYPSLPYQGEGLYMRGHSHSQNLQQPRYDIPPPQFNQGPVPEEIFDYNPESTPMPNQIDERTAYEPNQSYDQPDESSRRKSATVDTPVYSPPSFGPSTTSGHDRNQMASSSPVHRNRDSMQSNQMGESFNSPFSPINEYDDLPRRDSDLGRKASMVNSVPSNEHVMGGSSGTTNSSSNNKSQSAGDQQTGFLSNLVGSAKALLPKSNSKQMILPDDSSKSIVYDDKKGAWVDTNQPTDAGGAGLGEAPPPMNVAQPPASYSFAPKSAKTRYPKAQF